VHPDDLAMVSEINRKRQMGEQVPSRYEFRGIRKDGSQRNIEVSATMINYRGEPASLVYLRDITEYKNLEDQLRQAQKMEAIGTLAGGIAHDFNNILAAIIGFSEMVAEDIPRGNPDINHMQRVLNAASRGRELVQQILAFSRKTEHARHPVSISFVAKETLQFLRATIPTTIEIILDNTATSDTILATPVEVQQVLLNLATNAALSMQDKGGTLHISITDTVVELDALILESDIVPGEYVQLVVRDTGTGIAPDLMKRIFEPFFTTRKVGQGTGMGLAVVYGIVMSLHGSITVESEPGVGSAFQVLLPKITADLPTDARLPERSLTGKERVLFIDDEEFLVEWGQALLERMGYEVTTMNDSTEAFETFSSDPSRFDLVITDQTMPGITGLNLARELLKIRPDIPVILCTGHSESVTLDKLKEAGVREFLMKPLAKKDLAEVIRRVLDKETKA
jgi:signal transduction histidine kinase/ActR/RegA family two-component response regulator